MAKRIKTVTFTREINEDEKMAPQARGIVESVIEAHGTGTELEVSQVVDAMEGNITTRQPLERIFGYYAPKLEEAGLIEVTRTEGTASKPKKDEEAEDVSDELSDEDEDEDA